jgi:hypothetical protein
MIINESAIIPHIDNEPWLNQYRNVILKSIRSYSQPTIDKLSDYESFQTYIISHDLYSKEQKEKIIASAVELSKSSLKHLCAILPEPDIENLYEQLKTKADTPSYHEFFCDMWMIRYDVLIKDPRRRIELFIHSYEQAGRKNMTKLMKHVIFKYPSILNAWVAYDTAKVVRYYADIGKLVYFDDESMDVLINSLGRNELVNQTKLKELLRNILARKNCSNLKRVETLFSLG